MDRRKAMAVLMDCADAAEGTEFAEVYRMGKEALRIAEEKYPQRQDGLNDQLRDLVTLANVHGMYDAADWLQQEVK